MSVIVKGGGGGENLAEEIALNRQKIETAIENLAGKKTGADITPEDVLKGKRGYKGQELVVGTFDKDAFAEANKNGQYVWGKYEDKIINYPQTVLTFTQQNISKNPAQLKVTSSNVDLTTVDAVFFDGVSGTVSGTGQSYAFSKTELIIEGTTKLHYTYDAKTTTISIETSWGDLGGWGSTTKQASQITKRLFIGYTVSDLETAYPDGEEKDGYWYERVKGSKYGMFVDETNETEDPTKVRMIFPKIGDSYFRVINSTNMFMMCYSIKDLEVETESIGVYAFSNTFRFTELNKLKLKCKSIGNNAFESMGMDKKSYTKIFLSNRIATISAQAYNYSPFSTSSPNMKLYCESPSKPTGWSEYWNNRTSSTKLTTMWGVTESQFDAL